jgi:hypothetical protein
MRKVAAHVLALEINHVGGLICGSERTFQRIGHRSDGQNAAPVRDQTAIMKRGAGMEYFDADLVHCPLHFQSGRFGAVDVFEPGYRQTTAIIAGITPEAITTAVALRDDNFTKASRARPSTTASKASAKVALEAHHQRFAFGITEANVEFEHVDTIAVDHQAGKEHSLERDSERRHGRQHWTDHLAHDAILELLAIARHGRICAHATGIGTAVAVVDSFMVLDETERNRLCTVGKREEPEFLAHKPVLDDDAAAGGAETSLIHRLCDRAECSIDVFAPPG